MSQEKKTNRIIGVIEPTTCARKCWKRLTLKKSKIPISSAKANKLNSWRRFQIMRIASIIYSPLRVNASVTQNTHDQLRQNQVTGPTSTVNKRLHVSFL